MATERWSPFREFLNIQNDLDHAFRRTLGWPTHRPGHIWAPALESFARGNDLVVRLEVPGIDPDKVEISIKDHTLRIWGERRREETVNDEDYYAEEFAYGSFERTLTLPRQARVEDVKATYDQGVLEVVVPQGAAVSGARKVPVEVRKK